MDAIAENALDADVIFACGPMPMLRAIKKYAAENGMKVAQGVAYGNLKGYAVTMVDGSGIKIMTVATKFPSEEQKQQLMQAVNAVNISRIYRVQKLEFSPNAIQIVFADGVGTMKKIREFVDWFMALLSQHGAGYLPMPPSVSVVPACLGTLLGTSHP